MRWIPIALTLLAGCSGGETTPTDPPCVGTDCATADPCVEAVFFDLGNTLIEPNGDSFSTIAGIPAMLDALKANGLRIGVVTNTEDGWTEQDLRDALLSPELLDAFEVVLLSSMAAADPKPDPAIFTEAVGLLSSPPPIEQTAFVTEELEDLANKPEDPTLGARAAGMIGVYLSDGGDKPKADHTVPPAELPALADASWLACPPL